MGRLLTIAKSNTRQLVCLVFVNLFMFFLIAFTTYRLLHCCDAFSSKVLVINQMETVRLTLLKPNIEIITGQTLLPETSISVLTATLLSSVNALPESLGSFQDSFKSLLLTNACFFISKRGCSAIVPNSYGLNVIEQQIE